MDTFHLICVARAPTGTTGEPLQFFRGALRQAVNTAVFNAPKIKCPYRQLYSESHNKYLYMDFPDTYILNSSLVFNSSENLELNVRRVASEQYAAAASTFVGFFFQFFVHNPHESIHVEAEKTYSINEHSTRIDLVLNTIDVLFWY